MATALAMQRHDLAQNEAPNPAHFDFSVIDNAVNLSDSYALRYEVYCRERQFLTSENYPTRLEIDCYDNHAIHVGGVDNQGIMIGTVRLVLPSAKGFPLFEHCELFPEYQYLADKRAQQTTAEISRLAISKCYRRRLHDGFYDLECRGDYDVVKMGERRYARRMKIDDGLHRRNRPEIILGIYKTMYQASKRQGITHWFAAMEKSLLRLLRRYNIEFTPIGPELDYYGPVVPYIAEIADIEANVFKHCPEMLAEFVKGLEPELVPAYARIN